MKYLEFRDSEKYANMTVNSAIDDSEYENSAIDNYEYYHNIGFIQYDNYKRAWIYQVLSIVFCVVPLEP